MARLRSDRPAQWESSSEGYRPITYRQLDARIRALARGLLRLGVQPGDRVALLMENRPEWAVIDYAILSVGAVTVPMYCSYRAQDIAYVLNDCAAHVAITSGGNLLRHLLSAADEAPGLASVYALDCGRTQDARLYPLSALSEVPEDKALDAQLEERLGALGRDSLATLVYTSGTTGNPKGVMLTHGNILANLEAVPRFIRLQDDETLLSFLPLAHALERTGGHFMVYSYGLSVAFAERPDTVARNLTQASPTLMIAVPRLLEVLRSRMLGQVAKQPAMQRAIFAHFLALGLAARKGPLSFWQRMRWRVLDRVVGRRILERFGGRLRMMVSGGAPLSVEVAEFFEALGLPVLEGYGMTEASPLIAVNPASERRIGSVGKPAHNTEVSIAGDGEILARGANVMYGYWKRREETAEAMGGGWLHTGDLGRQDDDGYLYITGRKKDIIVTSGGENVAPQRIESLLVADELIDEVVVYGDRKPYLVALIVANEKACREWAGAEGLPESDWAELCASKLLHRMLQTRIGTVLHPLNTFEQVRRIHVLPRSLGEEGLLTPTMKVRRQLAFERYGELLEELYR